MNKFPILTSSNDGNSAALKDILQLYAEEGQVIAGLYQHTFTCHYNMYRRSLYRTGGIEEYDTATSQSKFFFRNFQKPLDTKP